MYTSSMVFITFRNSGRIWNVSVCVLTCNCYLVKPLIPAQKRTEAIRFESSQLCLRVRVRINTIYTTMYRDGLQQFGSGSPLECFANNTILSKLSEGVRLCKWIQLLSENLFGFLINVHESKHSVGGLIRFFLFNWKVNWIRLLKTS